MSVTTVGIKNSGIEIFGLNYLLFPGRNISQENRTFSLQPSEILGNDTSKMRIFNVKIPYELVKMSLQICIKSAKSNSDSTS